MFLMVQANFTIPRKELACDKNNTVTVAVLNGCGTSQNVTRTFAGPKCCKSTHRLHACLLGTAADFHSVDVKAQTYPPTAQTPLTHFQVTLASTTPTTLPAPPAATSARPALAQQSTNAPAGRPLGFQCFHGLSCCCWHTAVPCPNPHCLAQTLQVIIDGLN